MSSSHDDTIIVWDFLNYSDNSQDGNISNALNGTGSPSSSSSVAATGQGVASGASSSAVVNVDNNHGLRVPWNSTTNSTSVLSNLLNNHNSPSMPHTSSNHALTLSHPNQRNSNKNSPPSPMEGDD